MSEMTPTSVDATESAFFEAFAETWWDTSGPFWPLHRLNALRIDYIRDELCRHFHRDPAAARPLEGLTILDVGCGGGILSEAVARLGARVHGIDVVERNIRVATLHSDASGVPVRYELVTAEALTKRGIRYDVILNMEVVEHVAELPVFLHACASLLKSSGVMVVATINRTLLSYLFAIIGAEYILGWLPKGTHHWKKFRKPEEIRQLLLSSGMTLSRAIGVRMNPITRHLALTRNMRVNYMLVFAASRVTPL